MICPTLFFNNFASDVPVCLYHLRIGDSIDLCAHRRYVGTDIFVKPKHFLARFFILLLQLQIQEHEI